MFNESENELIKISLDGMKYVNSTIVKNVNSGMHGTPDQKLKEKEFKRLDNQNKIIESLFEKIKTVFIPEKEESKIILVALKGQINHIDFISNFDMSKSEKDKIVKAKNEVNELIKKIKAECEL